MGMRYMEWLLPASARTEFYHINVRCQWIRGNTWMTASRIAQNGHYTGYIPLFIWRDFALISKISNFYTKEIAYYDE